MSESESIGGLGEAGVLSKIFPFFTQKPGTIVGPGDDAAVIEASGRIVLTTDAIVENRDFILGISDPVSIGRKAAMQNLADVAAMGARPLWLLVTVLTNNELPVAVLEGIAEGIAFEADRAGASVIGGDLGTAGELTISITAAGMLDQGRDPVLRSGASRGEVLAVGAPILGLSYAGLAQVLARANGKAIDTSSLDSGVAANLGETGPAPRDGEPQPSIAERSFAWHLAPEPRIDLGWRFGHFASAMIDISDGLVRDAGRIAEASGVGINLDSSVLDHDAQALRPLADLCGVDPYEWVLGSGEEHAMLATFPRDMWESESLDVEGFRRIGTVIESTEGAPVLLDGTPARIRGWDHFE